MTIRTSRNVLLIILLFTIPAGVQTRTSAGQPNIVYILADDLGYGSLNSYGADPDVIHTPNINRLARQGMRFTNAVTASSVCSPTRYGLLMGRHPWRTRMKSGVIGNMSPLLPDPERTSLASWLDSQGYRSAAIGKWHLGYGERRKQSPEEWTGRLSPGPLELGFDDHFGVPQNHGGPLNIYVENHRIWKLESDAVHPYSRSFYGRPYYGFDAPQRVHKKVMHRLSDRAVNWLDRQNGDRPFFLYFAPVAVHHPITPSDRMRGESGSGPYGDFIQDLDDSVGRILRKLHEMGVDEDTLVIFTSDNGGDIPADDMRPEQQAISAGLQINGTLRGDKHTIWEGGVRVPFIARWPGHVSDGVKSDAPISLNDSFATLSELVDGEPVSADHAAPDSFSFARELRGKNRQGIGPPTVVANAAGTVALRWGPWKYIEGEFPDGVPKGRRRHYRSRGQAGHQLYHLGLDRGEETNLYRRVPELGARMQNMLDAIREHESTREVLAGKQIAQTLRHHIRQIDRASVKQALGRAGPARDLWAWKNIEVTGHSNMKSGEKFALQHAFNVNQFDGMRQRGFTNDRGSGMAMFADGNSSKGGRDFIEWRTKKESVTLRRIYIAANHDGKSPYRRGINHLRLIADTDGQSGFDPGSDRVLIDTEIEVPYGREPRNRGIPGRLDLVHELEKPVTARAFRLELTRSSDLGPRLLELSATP